jgi:hypothetical protein
MERLTGQDVMAIETQGGRAARQEWHLATGDRGVVLYERMLQREMARVQQGQAPYGSVGEPGQVIATGYEAFLELATGLQSTREGRQVHTRPQANGQATGQATGRAGTLPPLPGPVGTRA